MTRKMLPRLLLAGMTLGAIAGSHAQIDQPGLRDGSPLSIEINGQKIATDGTGGTITIRTDGDAIEIDTDGDGEAEQQIEWPVVQEMGWLGIKTTEISPELASQLELEGGAVIEMVLPDSPAEKSGLHDYDIVTAVGETGVDTPQELSAAIRAMRPGSAIGISVIRKAKPVEIVATLASRPPMPKTDELGEARIDLDLAPGGSAVTIREEIEQLQDELLKGMKLRVGGVDLPDLENAADIVRMSTRTTNFSDGDGSITITSKDGDTHIEAKDAAGKLLYEGPATTEDERTKLPPDVLEKLRRIEEMHTDSEPAQ